MKHTKHLVNVERGDFPFPLTGGAKESRYLTWLRNHSNYMVQEGFSDYLRIIAVLVRGIIINFLILMPYLVLVGVALSFSHQKLVQPQLVTFAFAPQEMPEDAVDPDMPKGPGVLTVTVRSNFGETQSTDLVFNPTASDRADALADLAAQLGHKPGLFNRIEWEIPVDGDGLLIRSALSGDISVTADALVRGTDVKLASRSPFLLSIVILLLAGVYVLMFPVFQRMTRVMGYRRGIETGYHSSVKRRDLFEKSFGWVLFAVVAVAIFEFLPVLSVAFNDLVTGGIGVVVPAFASIVSVLVAANRIVPLLGGYAKKIAMLAVGLIGFLIPLFVILLVENFLVHVDKKPLLDSDETFEWIFLPPLLLPAVFATLLLVTWVIGIRAFKLRGHLKIFGLILFMVVFSVFFLAVSIYLDFQDKIEELFLFITLVTAFEIWLYCWMSVDVNLTSINGLYRDRLASAYLVGVDTKGDIDIEQDIALQEICNYDAGSTAPYHLINTALNLQGSKDIGLRDRNSDFFFFSKRFIGGERTGFCRSESMEAVFPGMDLGTAMAISAAAASPNMGRGTNVFMVAFMTLLNIRLGFWIPNPDRMEKYLGDRKAAREVDHKLTFTRDVFPTELAEIEMRRAQVYGDPAARPLVEPRCPTTGHGLIGIGYSGGGIRSATLNLGITQALHEHGVFDHLDYMSTVSGGGYLGSSISALMRRKVSTHSEIKGTVSISKDEDHTIVHVSGKGDTFESRSYSYANDADLAPGIKEGTAVAAGERLLRAKGPDSYNPYVSLMDSFSWRVRPFALWREMFSKLDARHSWINLSDGGHIENMAAIELLRRRCKYIIIGDGEADPHLHFNGLATLIRYARIDLGIDIDINVDPLRLADSAKEGRVSEAHWAVGKIAYPSDPKNGLNEPETGYLLYLKSSFSGDEDEVIREYRHRNPAFPHQSTADQFFDEGQFEAYRALGAHIAEQALVHATKDAAGQVDFASLRQWFETRLWADGGVPEESATAETPVTS